MSELIRPGIKGRRWDLPRDDGVEYLACRIKTGADWWDLDDELGALPGCRFVYTPTQARWHAIPAEQLGALQAIAERNPGRVIVHRTQ